MEHGTSSASYALVQVLMHDVMDILMHEKSDKEALKTGVSLMMALGRDAFTQIVDRYTHKIQEGDIILTYPEKDTRTSMMQDDTYIDYLISINKFAPTEDTNILRFTKTSLTTPFKWFKVFKIIGPKIIFEQMDNQLFFHRDTSKVTMHASESSNPAKEKFVIKTQGTFPRRIVPGAPSSKIDVPKRMLKAYDVHGQGSRVYFEYFGNGVSNPRPYTGFIHHFY